MDVGRAPHHVEKVVICLIGTLDFWDIRGATECHLGRSTVGYVLRLGCELVSFEGAVLVNVLIHIVIHHGHRQNAPA